MLGKVTTWALSIGRYIVIFTELVVIVSFLSRFTLDRQVTDLNSEILAKAGIIESYGDLEAKVREVQKKIETYNQLKTKRPLSEIFDQLTRITPEDIQFQELNIQENTVQISARANSRSSLERFIENMQASGYFYNIISENISNTDAKTPGFSFEISASVGVPEPTRAPRRTNPESESSEVEEN